MPNRNIISLVLLLFPIVLFAQNNHPYTVDIQSIKIEGLPGIQSYAFAQADGKWLIIGGRLDGLHSRQPNSSFPESQNNTSIYVIDIDQRKFWTTPLSPLSVGLQEQLQSTNMNFVQDKDTLYIIGGYAYSASKGDHTTFDKLTTISVSSLIDAVMNSQSITPYFRQISDTAFAVTGGQLGKIDDTFYLVGGQKFDGRYNPMGHSTYRQEYTHQIRNFKVDNAGSQLSFSGYGSTTDGVHLRRRDYNLTPQIFPDGKHGYTIWSGVFQLNKDLPFLYPVDIQKNSYEGITTFNQYLSHYHSATANMYDSANNEMHTYFFGGLSEYFYENGSLKHDVNVPFVKTISRITRLGDGSLKEYHLPVSMPGLNGAGAEFIANRNLSSGFDGILSQDDFLQDTVVIGYIYGGISSTSRNPFINNQTSSTAADASIYKVRLIKDISSDINEIEGKNPYGFTVLPNPITNKINIEFYGPDNGSLSYFISNEVGEIIRRGDLVNELGNRNKWSLVVDREWASHTLVLTLIVDDRYYLSRKIIVQ